MRKRELEVILWSIALPGFGQILNRHLFKGTLFITLEFIINVQSNFNQAIMYSFLGEIDKAIVVTNYQWLMFYPCLYMFAIWDAYRDTKEEPTPFSFLPCAFCAYFVTIGLMYSKKLHIFGVIIGPIWLPILFLIPGLIIGFFIKYILAKCYKLE